MFMLFEYTTGDILREDDWWTSKTNGRHEMII